MISIVLYGRNDSYGYNLHKRAALSLNCMAEVLANRNDEILFVDYNTPDDFPTFPEAIQDTLTARAKRFLRVFRVRPSLHERFREQTHLVALEPIARNVAIRRSNPANRWILSTNTDMIFVPRQNEMQGRPSLGQVAKELPDGFYHLPRFEVPESLWETLDRHAPSKVISSLRDWGQAFHLNEIVLGVKEIKYDAPGDFQLILRSDLFDICGFDERMLLGWHVDSNMAKRLFLRYGRVGHILSDFFGYHCDHTRQVTPAHRPGSLANDIQTFVAGVTEACVRNQTETWGMPSDTIEEIRLTNFGAPYVAALRAVISRSMRKPTRIRYCAETYGGIDYDPKHVLPFLADVLINYPRTTQLGWFSCRLDLLVLFCGIWRELKFERPILVADEGRWPRFDWPAQVQLVIRSVIGEAADVMVFDFGVARVRAARGQVPHSDIERALSDVVSGFRAIVRAERRRLAQGPCAPRRFITINAIHNRFESMVRQHIGAAQAPIATRIRQGYLIQSPVGPRKLLAMMSIGGAGVRDGTKVRSVAEKPGYIVYGPYLELDVGRYRLRLEMDVCQMVGLDPDVIRVEVLVGEFLLAHHLVTKSEQQRGMVELTFGISDSIAPSENPCIEFRVWSDGRARIVLNEITLDEIDIIACGGDANEVDWLPLMQAGPAGQRILDLEIGRVTFRTKWAAGHVVYGPRYSFPVGCYELRIGVRLLTGNPSGDGLELGKILVLFGKEEIASRVFTALDMRTNFIDVSFKIPERDAAFSLDLQIWTNGKVSFDVLSASISECKEELGGASHAKLVIDAASLEN